jgi:hypothetical protein
VNRENTADQTSVTRHVTRGRLKRLKLINGTDYAVALELCQGDESQAATLLDAICLSWFGPVWGCAPRSDRGGSHALPQRDWFCCEWCHGEFRASREDARYCSNRCRQSGYRERLKGEKVTVSRPAALHPHETEESS